MSWSWGWGKGQACIWSGQVVEEQIFGGGETGIWWCTGQIIQVFYSVHCPVQILPESDIDLPAAPPPAASRASRLQPQLTSDKA